MENRITCIIEIGDTSAAQNLPTDLPVTMNFDDKLIVGYAHCYRKDDKIMADIELREDSLLIKHLLGCSPCIGGIVEERDGDKITKFKLTSVGFTYAPNVDPNIKKLSEQCSKTL